ncbi:acyl-CoA synthase [Marinobacter fuscus]|uniref:Acyl-CoA synthase n=2 Tax=Marinobacter fuscus TaxID=2109942 RepID=A0A2T1KP71_9GAMM|nr:acyl-CoA synthase [Marinobacter fuscus]
MMSSAKLGCDSGQPSSIAVQNLLERAAELWPDSPSITFEDRTFCWRETYERCCNFAEVLAAKGIVAGDRVAYLGFNSHWCFELFFAAPKAGAIALPLNFRLSTAEMIACMEDARPELLLVDEHHIEQAQLLMDACPWLKTVIYAGNGAPPESMEGYENLLSSPQPQCSFGSSGDDTLLIFYTGGTTGRSKGVMLTHNNQFTNALGGLSWYRMTERETHLLASPLFHTAAGSRVFTATMTGTHSVILSRFDVMAVMDAVQRYRINTMQIVPTMLQMMLEHPQFSDFEFSSLRLITYGAAPMPVALLERALNELPGVSFAQSYGMTEASPVVCVLDGDDHSLEPERLTRLESVGRPVFHNHVRIVDSQRKVLPVGQVGEIAVKGSNVMKGYWRAPELTDAVLSDGWYYTGDSGYFDEGGYLFLSGRIKDMIVSGGENVYPIEVENVLSRYPGVVECAVIGIPHEKWGEAVHAVVRLAEPGSATEQEIKDHCRGFIAHYKCPVAVTFVDEPLPISSVNKILKSAVRKMIIK